MKYIPFLLLLLIVTLSSSATPLGSEFTFQGRLEENNAPAAGDYELELSLFDAPTGGNLVAGAINRSVTVADGLFSVQLDFGDGPFIGDQRWLEVRVRAAGDTNFITLSPRHAITATPYALHAQFVGLNAVSGTEILDGSIKAADVDTSQLQRRVTGSCPAGESIRAVAQNGTVTCEPDTAGGNGFWDLTGSTIASEHGATITPADTAIPLSLVRDSHPSTPHLAIFETSANDFSRINLYHSDNPDRFWAVAGRIGASAAEDTLNFYNRGASPSGGGADIVTVKGTRHVGINDTTPLAPLTVRSLDNWHPDIGNGLGDFHVGDEAVGLSVGVALGGGGRGATRVWTNTQGALLLTTENSAGGVTIHDDGVRVEELKHSDTENRSVAVEADGDLVLGPPASSSAASLFGQFGGDGSDGDLVIDAVSVVQMGNFGQVLRKQYRSLDIVGRLELRSRFSFIAVQGECYLGGDIWSNGTGMPGAPAAGNSDDGQDGTSARTFTDLCVSGSGGNGGNTGITNPGEGGSAEGILGGTDPVKRGVLTGGITYYQSAMDFGHPEETTTDAFHQLLMCPGAGGGAGASGPDMTGGAGGAGGGVIYIECGSINGIGTLSAQGAQPQQGSNGGGEGGVGGGGVVLVRTLREEPDAVQWTVNVQALHVNSDSNDFHPRNGAPGYGDVVIVD